MQGETLGRQKVGMRVRVNCWWANFLQDVADDDAFVVCFSCGKISHNLTLLSVLMLVLVIEQMSTFPS